MCATSKDVTHRKTHVCILETGEIAFLILDSSRLHAAVCGHPVINIIEA